MDNGGQNSSIIEDGWISCTKVEKWMFASMNDD